jgi:hypothetical protein
MGRLVPQTNFYLAAQVERNASQKRQMSHNSVSKWDVLDVVVEDKGTLEQTTHLYDDAFDVYERSLRPIGMSYVLLFIDLTRLPVHWDEYLVTGISSCGQNFL